MKTILIVIVATLITAASATAVTSALITSAQIQNGTIRPIDLHPTTRSLLKVGKQGIRGNQGQTGLSGPQGAQGPAGPLGAQGVQGFSGPAGANGANGGFDPSKLSYVKGPDTEIPPSSLGTATAVCPAGTRATGGGYFSSITQPFALTTFSNGASWSVLVDNRSSITVTVNAYAVCAGP